MKRQEIAKELRVVAEQLSFSTIKKDGLEDEKSEKLHQIYSLFRRVGYLKADLSEI